MGGKNFSGPFALRARNNDLRAWRTEDERPCGRECDLAVRFGGDIKIPTLCVISRES